MLKLVLDQYDFAEFDFGRSVNFKIYDENDVLFTGSGYTAVIKALDEFGDQQIGNVSTVWDTGNNAGHFIFTQTLRAALTGFLWLAVELSKSGEQTTTTSVRCNFGPSSGTL